MGAWGAINRIPNEKQVRANLHIGGRAETKLTKRFKVCKKIKKILQEKIFFLLGLM